MIYYHIMNHETIFLNILKSSLWGTAIAVPQEFDEWGKVFALAKAQSVLGLVANAVLSDAEVARRIPADMQKRLKAFVMSNMATHSMLNNTLVRVFSLLDEAGVRSVLLKGQGLAKNYPLPELRQCGDIDVYVGEENYVKSHSLLSQISTDIDELDNLYRGKHFHVNIGNVLVEVHRFAYVHPSPRFNEIYQKYALTGLNHNLVRIYFGGARVNTPDDNFNAFYIFNHCWYHIMAEGLGLRQMCDWMLFLHSRYGSLDCEYLRKLLEDMDLLVPWKVFGCVLVNYLGMPQDEFPLYDSKYATKSILVLKRILKDGNFGKDTAYVRKRSHSYLYEKWFSLKCHISRSISMMRIFPRHAMRHMSSVLFVGFKAVWKDKFAKK